MAERDIVKEICDAGNLLDSIMLRGMSGSTFALILYSPGKYAELAYQIGLAVMLDKPLLVCSVYGAVVPEHLKRIAHSIIELEGEPMSPENKRRVETFIKRTTAELGLGSHLN